MKIGTVIVNYDQEGNVLEKFTAFVPTMNIPVDKELGKQLIKLKQENNETILKDNSDLILASWFSKMNEIELADRNSFKIESMIVSCDKYSNGKIRKCILDYYFERV
jgi:hypothetical protein